MKFTEEIKQNWLNALKSGKYKQGYTRLRQQGGRYCCLGVLADITPGLSIDASGYSSGADSCVYQFLGACGISDYHLYRTNDSYAPGGLERPEGYKDDYSNVIPLIEALPTAD